MGIAHKKFELKIEELKMALNEMLITSTQQQKKVWPLKPTCKSHKIKSAQLFFQALRGLIIFYSLAVFNWVLILFEVYPR